MIEKYIIAADNFIVYRPSFGHHTLIAGYPWFLDWGRDALISFEGLLLMTKKYEYAKDVLLTAIRDIKFGLVPNGYSGYDNRPLYNSADASLLLFEQVNKYLQYTKEILEKSDIYYPSVYDVIDVKVTHEVWVLKEIEVKCIGIIESSDCDYITRHNTGRGMRTHFHHYPYKWVEKYF